MADQEVALQVRSPTSAPTPAYDPGSSIGSAQTILGNETSLQAGQTKLQMLGRENAGQDIQFRNQLISNAAAHALDADSWDAAMRSAVQKGAPEAAQYVGRYTPLLQQRLFDAYSGQPAGGGAGTAAAPAAGGGATSTDMLDRMYANVPQAQMAQSLQKNNMILRALSTVKDQQSYDQAIAGLSTVIPNVAQLAGPYNPMQVIKLWNDTQARVGYLQNRVAAAGTGAPNPLVKNETSSVGGVDYSVDPYQGTAKPMTPPVQKPVPDAFDKNGNPIFYTEQGGVVPHGAGTVGPEVAAARIQKAENNTGDPGATNPRSSATGNGQFIDSTWLDTVKTARPELAKSLSDKQILALRTDPDFSADMTKALATQNAATLTKANLPVTTASLALAHRFGADGATKIMNADPNTPMESLVSPKVLEANPELKGQTAGAYAQTLMKQVGNDPVTTDQPNQIFHKGQFDKPQLAEVDDGQGGTKRLMLQQDNRTGQWVTADEKRTPVDATNLTILPESIAAGGGGRNTQIVTRILSAASDATSDIKNIVELPLAASTGWFGGVQNATPKSLIGATKDVLAQSVTGQDVQDFNTSMIGIGKALAALESGGMATNQALIDQFDRLALKEGDTNLTKMRKLATMRQNAENALNANITSPLLGKEQKEMAKKLVASLADAVPWTPHDVTMLQRSNNPSATMGDFAKSAGLPSFVAGQTYRDAKGASATYGGKDGSGKDIWTPVQ